MDTIWCHPKNGSLKSQIRDNRRSKPITAFWSWGKGVRAELEMVIGSGWSRHDRPQPKWMQEKRQSCMGKAATEVSHILCCVWWNLWGNIWTHEGVALPAFISGWVWNNRISWAVCRVVLCAWGRDAAFACLDHLELWSSGRRAICMYMCLKN